MSYLQSNPIHLRTAIYCDCEELRPYYAHLIVDNEFVERVMWATDFDTLKARIQDYMPDSDAAVLELASIN